MSVLRDTATLHRMVRYNAAREILDCVGDVSELGILFGNQVLLATYIHSGIMWSERLGFPLTEKLSLERLFAMYDEGKGFLSQQDALESVHVGKVHLVLKLGQTVDESLGLKIGQWVWTLPENTRGMNIQCPGAQKSRILKELGVPNYNAGWPCKIAYASDLYGILPDQDVLV